MEMQSWIWAFQIYIYYKQTPFVLHMSVWLSVVAFGCGCTLGGTDYDWRASGCWQLFVLGL